MVNMAALAPPVHGGISGLCCMSRKLAGPGPRCQVQA